MGAHAPEWCLPVDSLGAREGVASVLREMDTARKTFTELLRERQGVFRVSERRAGRPVAVRLTEQAVQGHRVWVGWDRLPGDSSRSEQVGSEPLDIRAVSRAVWRSAGFPT